MNAVHRWSVPFVYMVTTLWSKQIGFRFEMFPQGYGSCLLQQVSSALNLYMFVNYICKALFFLIAVRYASCIVFILMLE